MREERLSSQRIYEGRVVNVRVDTLRRIDGHEVVREIIEHKPVVVVLPIDDSGSIVMVKQYRTPVRKELLELPAGGIETGEQPEAAVIRELQEEIGYKPGTLAKLGGFYSAPGFTDEYLHAFIATGLVQSSLRAEDTDEIEITRVPFDDIPALIADGRIIDAKTLAVLILYQYHDNKG